MQFIARFALPLLQFVNLVSLFGVLILPLHTAMSTKLVLPCKVDGANPALCMITLANQCIYMYIVVMLITMHDVHCH